MKLFTLTLRTAAEEQAEKLSRALFGSGAELHNEDNLHMELYGGGSYRHIEVRGQLPGFELHRDGPQVYVQASEGIAEYIIAEEERSLLRSMIRQDFRYKKEEEVQSILNYCTQVLDGAADPETAADYSKAYARRKDKIAGEISEYLAEYTEFNLEGFLRFRLHAYRQELREVVEYAIDEFVMDRQYQEFISLLQYFVYIQEAKIPFVHLIHKGGADFLMLNDQLEVIEADEAETVVTVEMIEKDMNFEDMIVSTLITLSPGHIYIHTREPELQVIKTIAQIFENRVQVCGYCRLCHNLDRSTAAEYNKG